ncbi:Protein of unknown function (DUF2992) [Sphaerochaeta pleomorpha str. Grapes]|uniref:DUF2992 family protein n=1 Tax=Sphaerochaeta pleomorpha (strain ATCC BAA-1885 / DSM 22778 / Grapes) TaxID=158190 RepID=G8QYZ7_SPHPG|nr:YjdF family protein [Sphaerochaeta pleomorpha]AEV30856.1 Protein of unknown function (DUF2992) [Sphaerochaeta pleomorpha str. Grapes]
MEKVEGSCTVYFDDPFWVGVFERTYRGTYQVARVVFGSEPSSQEFLDFLTFHYDRVIFSIPVKTGISSNHKKIGAKRSMRNAKKEASTAIGTASQIALQRQRELMAKERKQIRKQNRETRGERLYLLHKEKKKQAKKGR